MGNKPYKIVIVYGFTDFHKQKSRELQKDLKLQGSNIEIITYRIDNNLIEKIIFENDFDKIIFIQDYGAFQYVIPDAYRKSIFSNIPLSKIKLCYSKVKNKEVPLLYDVSYCKHPFTIQGKQDSSLSTEDFLSEVSYKLKASEETVEDNEIKKDLDMEEKSNFMQTNILPERAFDKRLLLFF